MAKEQKQELEGQPQTKADAASAAQQIALPAQIGFRADQLTRMVERGEITNETRARIERVQAALADAGLAGDTARYLYAGYLQRTGRKAGDSVSAAALTAEFKKHIATAKGGN